MPAPDAAWGPRWAGADGAACARSPRPLRSARVAGSARHPSTVLRMALSNAEGPQRGQANTSSPPPSRERYGEPRRGPGGGGNVRRMRSAQRRSASAEQPSFGAVASIAAHCDPWAAACSRTIRTARSFISGEYFGCRPMGSILSPNVPSDNPGKIHSAASATSGRRRVSSAGLLPPPSRPSCSPRPSRRRWRSQRSAWLPRVELTK